MHLRANRRFWYGGRNINTNEEFDAPDLHGERLILTGLAMQAQNYSVKALIKRKRGRPRKNEYDRRDMRAAD